MNSGSILLTQLGDGASSAYSVAPGFPMPAGWNAYMWNAAATPLSTGLSWDPSAYTGFAAPGVTTVKGVSPSKVGTSAVQISADSKEIGVVIDSDDYIPSPGSLASGSPLPFIVENNIGAGGDVPVFSPTSKALLFHTDMRLPTAIGPVVQVVLYLVMRDKLSGHTLSYGLTIYDSRGSGPSGGSYFYDKTTGSAVVTSNAGEHANLSINLTGSTSLQSQPFSEMSGFDFEITPETLTSAVGLANDQSGDTTLFSTNPSDYSLLTASVDAEIPYFGGTQKAAYTVTNLSVTRLASVALVAANKVPTVVQAGQTIDILDGTPSTVLMNDGAECVNAYGTATIALGTGSATIRAYGQSVTVSGGSGELVFVGGNGTMSVSGGATSNDRISGHKGNGVLSGGTGGNNVVVAGDGDVLLLGAGYNDVLVGGAGSDTLVGSAAGRNRLTAGSGNQTLTGGGWNDTLLAGAGAGVLAASSAGHALLAGSSGNVTLKAGGVGDSLFGGSGRNVLMASDGNASMLVGGAGSNLMYGGAGAQMWAGASGHTTIKGGAGPETLAAVGGGAEVSIFSGSGDSLIVAQNADHALNVVCRGGNSVVFTEGVGLQGLVSVVGGDGGVLLVSEGGTSFQGGAGADTVFCIAGATAVSDGSGHLTVVIRDQGNDRLTLGRGNTDIFYLGKNSISTNIVLGKGVVTNFVNMDFTNFGVPDQFGNLGDMSPLQFSNAAGQPVHGVMSEEVWQGVTILRTLDGGQVNLWNVADSGHNLANL